MTNRPRSFVDPTTRGKRVLRDKMMTKYNDTPLPRKILQKPYQWVYPRTSIYPGYDQWTYSYGLKRRWRKCYPWTNKNDRTNSRSVAYACGFGYNNITIHSSHSPTIVVSNTYLHNEAKNCWPTRCRGAKLLSILEKPDDAWGKVALTDVQNQWWWGQSWPLRS